MRKAFIPALLFFLFIFVSVLTGKASSEGIVYVPLDERPLNLGYVKEIAQAANIPLLTPPDDLLPGYKTPADTDALWSWALAQKGEAAVLSADALVYGGLLSSRSHEIPAKELTKRADNFRKYREAWPGRKIFVFVTVMRTPNADSKAEEPDYYERYGKNIFRISVLEDKKSTVGLETGEEKELAGLKKLVPEEIYSDWLDRRKKNLAVTERLVEMTREGIIDFLVLCRDDTSRFGRSRQEYRELQKVIKDLPPDKFASFPGADEAGLILVTRAALENKAPENKAPKVYVSYAPGAGPETVPGYEDVPIKENVSAHVKTLNCKETEKLDGADLALVLNSPRNGITGEAARQEKGRDPDRVATVVSDIEKFSGRGVPVVLADVAYSNGADGALAESLRKKGLLLKLAGYAGMNTAGNALGYALAQGLLLGESGEKAKKILITRLLDDWGYQANVRQVIRRNSPGKTEEEIRREIEERLSGFAEQKFGIRTVSVDIFWHQTFNVGVKIPPLQ